MEEEPKFENHPDYGQCYTSLVTDRMYNDSYLNNHRKQFCCSLGNKQPLTGVPILSHKKKEYKARLFCAKLKETNQILSSDEWEVPTADALLSSDLARFVHFSATNCSFNGSVESLVVNCLHDLILAVKSRGNDIYNPSWLQTMNSHWAEEYWEAACIEVETLEKMDA